MYPHQQNVYYQEHSYSQYDQPVPLTPLDLSYSQSMIPSSLVVGSPYIMNSFPMSPHIPQQQQQHQFPQQPQVQPPNGSSFAPRPYMGNHPHHHMVQHHHSHHNLQNGHHHYVRTHHDGSSNTSLSYKIPSQEPNLDSLCLSRTVVLKNLSEDLSMEELLDVIDFGPIEYCKMFKKAAPSHYEDVKNLQTCYISFLNSKISINFHLKYGKNKANLNKLKAQLKDSKYMKISLNEPTSNRSGSSIVGTGAVGNRQDFIKLKTLNYIMDLNATRSLTIQVVTNDEEIISKEIKTQCEKFGEVEKYSYEVLNADEIQKEKPDLVIVNGVDEEKDEVEAKDTEKDDEKKDEEEDEAEEKEEEEARADKEEVATEDAASSSSIYSVFVHFTSIDAAIRCYEYNVKNIQNKQKSNSPIEFVSFSKDRCDKSPIDNLTMSQPPTNVNTANSTTASSPVLSRRNTSSHSHFLPNESIISIPEDDSFGSEGSELSEFNPSMILENNESLRKSLINNKRIDRMSTDQLSSSSSSERDQSRSNNTSTSMISMMPPSMASMPSMGPMIPPPLALPHHHTMQYPYNLSKNDSQNVGNRTIYLGNLHPNTTIEDIANNIRAGGIVQTIRHYPEKKVCFITFIDPVIALKFFLNHEVLHQLVIHGYDITVGWAKNHSGPLSREIALAVTAGASRNVYIGIKPNTNPKDGSKDGAAESAEVKKKVALPDEETLRKDFSKFGELEQINFYHNKDCGFLNFLNISDAIKLVDSFGLKNIEKVNKIVGDSGEFYEKYSNFKISFAKDRCGYPPKFNIKKKNRNNKKKNFSANQSVNTSYRDEDLYVSDIVNELREFELQHEQRKSKQRTAGKDAKESNTDVLDESTDDQEGLGEENGVLNLDDEKDGEISEEAAMVFGIISKKENTPKKQINGSASKHTGKKEKEDDSTLESILESKNNDAKPVAPATISEAEEDEEEEAADGDESDDEVSIIINPDDMSSSSFISEAKSPLKTPSKPHKSNRSGNRRNNSDLFLNKRGEFSRNSSNLSLNSGYSKNGYYNGGSLSKFQQAPPSPYQQPAMYYYPPQRPSSTPIRNGGIPTNGYYGYGSPGAPPTPPQTAMAPQMVPHHPQYNQYYHQQVSAPQYGVHGYSSQPHLGTPKSYGTSGSQVMAQYLAQSQHESLLYAAAIYNNGLDNDDEPEYHHHHYKGKRSNRR